MVRLLDRYSAAYASNQFRALQQETRRKLEAIYARTQLPTTERAAMKAAAMREFRESYYRLRDSWGGDPARFKGYTDWVESANNAAFGAQAVYDELVPAFEALFHREGDDFKRFYARAKEIGKLPKPQRRERLTGSSSGQ